MEGVPDLDDHPDMTVILMVNLLIILMVILMVILSSSAVVQSPDESLVRPGGRGGPGPQVTPSRVHSLHRLPAPEEAAAEAVVPVVHDAVTVILRVQAELQGIPRVVNPLVWQHVEIVYPDMLVPVVPGVGMEQPHVVHQLVSDDPYRVSVRGVEAGQDPHAARETR